MTTVFMETPDATQNGQFWSSVAGSVTYDTSQKKSGLASWKCDSGAGNAAAYLETSKAGRYTFYIRFTNFPDSAIVVAGGGRHSTRITAGGVLQLWDSTSGIQIGSDGSTLVTGTWYRICVVGNGTTAKLFLNGIEDVSGASVYATSIGYIGWLTAPGASKVLNFHHVYVDNSAALTDTGDMRVTAKLPNSVVHNSFDTTGGTGAVNERPVSETNYKQHAATTQVHQDYDIQTAAGGDVDISADTIVSLDFWVWAKRGAGAAGTPALVYQADTEQAITLGTAYALFNKIVDTATYPSVGASVIGMESTGAGADTFLAECGVLVAYRVAAGAYWTATLAESLSPADAPLKIPTKRLLDNPILAEALVKAAAKILMESPALTDSLVKKMAKVLAESLPTAEELVRMVWPHPALAESMPVADAVVKAVSAIRSEAIAAVEDLLTKTLTKVLSESLAIADALVKGQTKTMAESLNLNDALRLSWIYVRALDEAMSVLDAVYGIVTKGVVLTDSLVLDEAMRKAMSKVIPEEVALTDLIIRLFSRIASETLILSDAISTQLAGVYLTVLAEPLDTQDALVRVVQRILGDTLAVIDSIKLTYQMLLSEAILLADALTIIAQRLAMLPVEPLSYTEAVLKQPQKVLAESLVLQDALTSVYMKLLAEGFTPTEAIHLMAVKIHGEAINIDDRARLFYTKILAEELPLADVLTAQIVGGGQAWLQVLAETAGFQEALRLIAAKSLLESVALDDFLVRSATLPLVETLVLAEGLLKIAWSILSESLGFADGLTLAQLHRLDEALTLADALALRIVGPVIGRPMGMEGGRLRQEREFVPSSPMRPDRGFSPRGRLTPS